MACWEKNGPYISDPSDLLLSCGNSACLNTNTNMKHEQENPCNVGSHSSEVLQCLDRNLLHFSDQFA